VVKVAWSSRRLREQESMGVGIWHILCIKEHCFINNRGLKPEQRAEPPHFNH